MSRPSSGKPPIDWAALRARLARAAGEPAAGAGARAALEARARRLAAAPAPARPAGTLAAVAFELGGERYAVEAAAVREVLRSPRPVRLPGAPPFVAGLVNLRGELVDVLDVRGFLGAPAAAATDRRCLIVLGGARAELALQVDGVEGLVELDPAGLAPPPDAPARTRPEYVRGLAPDGLALLDAPTLLRDPRLVVDQPSTEVT